MKKLVALMLAVMMVFALTAVAFAEDVDWETFEEWTEEDWDSKTISYQFTGEWELAEYNISLKFLINLYDDGSALVDQYNILGGASYQQFGYWSEENTEDGNEIAFDTLFCTPNAGEEDLVAHEYSYELYEEEDGNYSFGYTFGIAAGSYFREADMVGGPEIEFETVEDFRTAATEEAAEAAA